ncbi:MAG: alpha/beta fold hydrolase [Bacteroidota bacterium]
MPLLKDTFEPSFFFRNPHTATIYPYFVRKLPDVSYTRERLELPDGDFLDFDTIPKSSSHKVAVITHGLEGSSSSKYVMGMGNELHQDGWEVVALNLRGCSGESNRLSISYHAGKTDDLHTLLTHLLKTRKQYEQVALIGFSLGGNLTLRYMGTYGAMIPAQVKAAIAISAPCDLLSSVKYIRKSPIYLPWLLQKMKRKALARLNELPEGSLGFSVDEVRQAKGLEDIDGLYTAPIHGFGTAENYYQTCSSLPVLPEIKHPTLLINAYDDSFLGEKCYPIKEAQESDYFHFLPSRYGGHVGFASDFGLSNPFWHEKEAVVFLSRVV